MPIYEYQCKECGHVFDALQKMSDSPLLDCPACNKPELRKLLSAPNFRLKGGGWYETDFKDKNQRNLAEGSTSSESSSAAKSADKSADKSSSDKSSGDKSSSDKVSSDKSASTASDKSSSTASDKPAAKSVKKSG